MHASHGAIHWRYLKAIWPDATQATLVSTRNVLGELDLSSPKSGEDLNALGVLLLERAILAPDTAQLSKLLQQARQFFRRSLQLGTVIGAVHLAFLKALTGDRESALTLVQQTYQQMLFARETDLNPGSPSLLFLPPECRHLLEAKHFAQLATGPGGPHQALTAAAVGLALFGQDHKLSSSLSTLGEHLPATARWHLLQGTAFHCDKNQSHRTLFHLHQAHALAPEDPKTHQALYLTYLHQGQRQKADYYKRLGSASQGEQPQWQWSREPSDTHSNFMHQRLGLLLGPANLNTAQSRSLLTQRDWDRDLQMALKPLCRAGNNVVDVGAGFGLFCHWAQSLGSRVTAFEHRSNLFSLLERNARTLGVRPQLHPWAVSTASGTRMAGQIEQGHSGPPQKNLTPSPRVTQVICLDDYLGDSPIDLLHLQQEGCELDILQGSHQLLSNQRPIICLNNAQKQIHPVAQNLLWARGYRLYEFLPAFKQLNFINNKITSHRQLIAIAKEHSPWNTISTLSSPWKNLASTPGQGD